MAALLGSVALTGCQSLNSPYSNKTDIELKTASYKTLETVLAAQPEKAKARYEYRHPQETLEFFGIIPGMSVGEALPGGGWYSKILLPYLGDNGHLLGVDYSLKMWPKFGGFANAEFLENKKTWADEWTAKARGWTDSSVKISATTFGEDNSDMTGTLDAFLFIRASHNLSRFEDDGAFLSEALGQAHNLLKPGGILGVVQHQGPESHSDTWAKGNNGYLKKSILIGQIEAAGFKLVDESDVNTNPKDNPSEADNVWRLPPTLGGSKDKPELRAKREAIGESNRMTLKFEKT